MPPRNGIERRRVFRGPELRRRPDQLPSDSSLPLTYRYLDLNGAASSADGVARDVDTSWLEATLIVADEPLSIRRLVQASGAKDAALVRRNLRKLQSQFDAEGSAFRIEEVAGGFQLLSRPEFHRWLAALRRGHQELRLTPASRETLAIVAYRQPIPRADIEAIRGVHCGDTLRLLMEKGLVKIVGRDESLGRPVLYGTSKKFLQAYGLRSLEDLPNVESLRLKPSSLASNPPPPPSVVGE